VKRRSRRPPKGKLATAQDLAKINFEPWKWTPDMREDELLPIKRIWSVLAYRPAWLVRVMLRTRDELIDMYEKVDYEDVDKMMTSILQASQSLKQTLHMLNASYVRILAVAAAHATGKFKGVDA
jgi:hypothetical protein